MIERILPAAAAVATRRHDEGEASLFPQEATAVAGAVERRRSEFATGRACAREALARLGVPQGPIPTGPRGAPLWPEGFVGSITHCEGYRACAVARRTDLIALGIDAEPDAPLPSGLLADIALPAERDRLARLADERRTLNWDRLLFSIKESIYKAWFPLSESWLGFEDALVSIDAERGTFSARLLVPGPDLGDRPLRGFDGRWLSAGGVLMAAVAVRPAGQQALFDPP